MTDLDFHTEFRQSLDEGLERIHAKGVQLGHLQAKKAIAEWLMEQGADKAATYVLKMNLDPKGVE